MNTAPTTNPAVPALERALTVLFDRVPARVVRVVLDAVPDRAFRIAHDLQATFVRSADAVLSLGARIGARRRPGGT